MTHYNGLALLSSKVDRVSTTTVYLFIFIKRMRKMETNNNEIAINVGKEIAKTVGASATAYVFGRAIGKTVNGFNCGKTAKIVIASASSMVTSFIIANVFNKAFK